MPLLVVTSEASGAGKTGVAAAIARHYAYQGRPVALARLADGSGNAVADAAFYAGLDFAPGSPEAPILHANAVDPGPQSLLVVEACLEAAQQLGGASVLVARDVAPKQLPDGLSPIAVVVTDVHGVGTTRAATIGTTLVVEVGEDEALAGFSVGEAQQALRAEVLVAGEAADTTCDRLVISPISSDAGQPHLRRFPSKAVVVRFDRTDMHLAALKSDPSCLILTGGRRPSDYLFDAASAAGVPVLLSLADTENTVIALEGIWDKTRFQGERKLDRMCELLESSDLFHGLEM
ncbi:MAG: DRTGG domain-containing protein [Dehalococcoidia bacterium]